MRREKTVQRNLALFILALILAACAPAEQPLEAAAPTSMPSAPTGSAQTDYQATLFAADAAATQAAQAGAAMTAQVVATTEIARATQAEFDRQVTAQVLQVTLDAATSQAQIASDQATANAQGTANAEATRAQETAQAGTATATVAAGQAAIQHEREQMGLQRERDRQWFNTWWPVIVVGVILAIALAGAWVAFLLIVRGFNLAELKLLAQGSFDTILLNAREANASWWKHILNWLFGTGSKTIVKPGRLPGPVIEMEPEPREDGHRAHAPQLAPPGVQERATARDQTAQLIHEWRQGSSGNGTRTPATSLQGPTRQTQAQPALPEPANGANDDTHEGEWVVVEPGDPAHTRIAPWIADVRGQLTAGSEEETA